MLITENKIPKKHYIELEKKNQLKQLQTELILPSIPKLSDELIVKLEKYKQKKYCGLLIEHKYINKLKIIDKELKQLENYFKYKTIGIIPESNIIPVAKTLKNGNINIDYKRIDSQIINFDSLFKSMRLEIEKVNFSFTNPKFMGSIDIVAIDNNIKSKVISKKRVLIQLVTTSLINDKYKNKGWHLDNLAGKNEITIKAIHLKLLAKYEWGISDIPFYYFVFSNKNEWEYKVFEICVDSNTVLDYYNSLKNVKYYLNEQINNWTALPIYKKCISCQLNTTCNKAQNIAEINKIYI